MAKIRDVLEEVVSRNGGSMFQISKDAGMGFNIYTSLKNEDGIKLSTLKRFFKAANEDLVIKVGDKTFKIK